LSFFYEQFTKLPKLKLLLGKNLVISIAFFAMSDKDHGKQAWSAESSLRVLQKGILANKMAHAKSMGLFVCWLPGQDSNLQPRG
jgi:hypothetical protein